uniref:Chitin-binding type-2 domain-containing protein n=1 Tax=Anopheles christyi TaxID=43041 RepID=A0A182KGE1_9DIPT
MSGWPFIILLALASLTFGAQESCLKCGYPTGHKVRAHSHCAQTGPRKYFRDQYDCGKFYQCNRGTAYEFLCAEGLGFNEEQNACEHISKVRCPTESSDPSNTHQLEHDFVRASGAGQRNSSSTCNICKQAKQAIPRHANCPRANRYYPVMFRNQKDCSQFYQCDHGTAYLIQCPAGLHFNTRLSVCDYPRNVDCSGPVLNEEVAGVENGHQGNSCPVCASATNEVRNHPECPTRNGHYPVMFRHRTDCAKYYQCDNGAAFEITCPAGLHFNTALNVCDYPENVACTGGQTGGSQAATEKPTVGESVPKVHPNCPAITGQQEPAYWAHPHECGKYFGCQWGCVELLSCPAGHRWDDAKKACSPDRSVECENAEW